MSHANRKIVIAGTGSGVGKTTMTIGLMAALQRLGRTVQGFKCGPDYIDPTYHTAVTGRVSRNLDSYMLSHDTVKEIYARASRDADISVIEGVMGFYDGKDPLTNEGSTAEISMLLEAPVLLVVNCQSMARSAAAIVRGFQVMEPRVNIVGVIANKVGSDGHYKLVRAAIEQECGIPVVGYMKREEHIEMPERHLGLVPSIERGELQPFFDKLAELVSATVDVERIWELAESPAIAMPDQADDGRSIFRKQAACEDGHAQAPRVKIAVAKDAAFNFYYQENFELLEAYGAEIVFFSPLAGETLPEGVHGLYLGGGFPEEFAAALSADEAVKQSIRQGIERGLPTLAECGGFMYLTQAIVHTDGLRYPMLGLIPGHVAMQRKLAALGYRDIAGTEGNFLLGPSDKARGHEFHYSTFHPDEQSAPPARSAYETKGLRGTKREGYLNEEGTLVAGYTHIHFASEPAVARRWVEKCMEYVRKGDM